MAEETDLILEQQSSLFASEDSNVQGYIRSLQEFGDNVAQVVETIVGFFEYTKFLLQSLADPLSLLLLPTLDALIAYLEDLKDIGSGVLTVWPWECGTLPPPVDTSKLEQGLDAVTKFIAKDNPDITGGIDSTNATLNWTPDKGYTLVENPNKSNSQLVSTEDKVFVPEMLKSTDLDGKSKWIELMSNIKSFLHPSEWEGPFDEALAEFLSGISYFLDKRELTPQQVIDKIIESLEDSGDANKPTGSGDYTAMIMLFTMPSFSQFNQVINNFYDYFGGVLIRNFEEAEENSASDSKKITLELGDPVIVAGVKTRNEIEDDLNKKLSELNDQRTLLATSVEQIIQLTGDTQTNRNISEINDEIAEKISQLEGEIEELNSTLEDYDEENIGSVSKVMFFNDVELRPISKDLNSPEEGFKSTNDRTKNASQPIPMFTVGDYIVQGNYLTNFSAKVESHVIHVKNGVITKNTVKLSEVRGELQKNYSTKGVGSAGVIRQRGIDERTYGIIVAGGQASVRAMKTIPMFLSPGTEIPQPEIGRYKFIATIIENDNVLRNVLPYLKNKPDVAGANSLKEFIDYNRSLNNQGPASTFDLDLLGSAEFQTLMVDFLKSLNLGMQVGHDFLNTDDLAPSTENQELVGLMSAKKLLRLLPGLGANFSIAQINLRHPDNDSDVKTLSKGSELRDLFIKDDTNKVVAMRSIEIVLGQQTSDGSFNTDSLINRLIDVPDNRINYWEFLSNHKGNTIYPFEVYSVPSGTPPNWKFIRIQDFLPVYGRTIDDIIKFVQWIRGGVTWVSDQIDSMIDWLNDEIQSLIQFNQKLQSLIQLLTQGFNAAGLYSVTFSGKGGVPNFKSRLSNAKFLLQRSDPFPEVELGTVQVERIVKNPVTGLNETITTTTLKPTVKKVDTSTESIVPEPVSPGDLDSLRYSGAVVFYAQGRDQSKLDTFLQNFGLLETFASSLYSNLMLGDGIAEKLKPYILEIQIQRSSDGEYVNCESQEAISNTRIRIVVTNDSHELTESEQAKLAELQKRTVDFTPRLLTSAIKTTQSQKDVTLNTSSDVFVVRKGNNQYIELAQSFETNLKEVEQGERQEFYIYLRPLEDLNATEVGDDKYHVEVKDTLISNEKLKLKDSFQTISGFDVEQTALLDVGLTDGF